MCMISLETLPLFLKPDKVEKYLGISIKSLREGIKKGIYVRGKHFYIPKGKKYTYWSTKSLFEWMTSSDEDEDVTELVNNILQIS